MQATAEQLIDYVCTAYGVPKSTLKGKRRNDAIVKARKALSYGLRLLRYKTTEIAGMIGYASHSDVSRNVAEIEWNLTQKELEAIHAFVKKPHNVHEHSVGLLELLEKHLKNPTIIGKLAYELQKTYELNTRNTDNVPSGRIRRQRSRVLRNKTVNRRNPRLRETHRGFLRMPHPVGHVARRKTNNPNL